MAGSKKLFVCGLTQRQIDIEDHRFTHQTSEIYPDRTEGSASIVTGALTMIGPVVAFRCTAMARSSRNAGCPRRGLDRLFECRR
jgi:hypothetical protein